jgi:hypothetical protein
MYLRRLSASKKFPRFFYFLFKKVLGTRFPYKFLNRGAKHENFKNVLSLKSLISMGSDSMKKKQPQEPIR